MSNGPTYYVYILASHKNGTLYTGVTNNLLRRVAEHKEGIAESFSTSHNVNRLVHMEVYESIELAIEREKRLKRWQRQWKIDLIEKDNPDWRDLYFDLNHEHTASSRA